MQISHIDRKKTGLFSEQQQRLVYDQESAQEYIYKVFSKDALKEQMALKSKQFSAENRVILVNSIQDQYKGLSHDAVQENIESLRDSATFTVTTGHQLTLLAGPFYFALKILQVIKLAKELTELHPDQHFVPIYWMASEDHDFEEIQSTTLFNKLISIDYKQQGPVGRFDLTALDAFKDEIKEFFDEDKHTEVFELLSAYSGKNLGEATRGLVHALFADYGLVIIDGDYPALKECFKGTMRAEILDKASEKIVLTTSENLKSDGFKVQVHPRPINLFYIEKGIRERIVEEDGSYKAGAKSWSKDEVITLLDQHPENFSPNVVLRPVYQETILPNLAYVGGAGEISYWLQLKGVFELYNVQFPLIQVRNSLFWIDKTSLKKIDKTELQWEEIFTATDQLKKEYVETHASDTLDFELLDELKLKLGDEMRKRVLAVNPNLGQFASAEEARLEKQLDGIKGKLIKDSKGKHEQAMKDIEFIKERLFPNGGLQERSINFLSLCADGQVQVRLKGIYDALEPFGKDMIVILETES
ncbi:MAG: bacillithiol biosynthesis cysteine-adding enzyme BshC [Crocinitomicaceae bacterium]|jgi:bacillithiol biosynthesis cysteine-adding enzyme BshC